MLDNSSKQNLLLTIACFPLQLSQDEKSDLQYICNSMSKCKCREGNKFAMVLICVQIWWFENTYILLLDRYCFTNLPHIWMICAHLMHLHFRANVVFILCNYVFSNDLICMQICTTYNKFVAFTTFAFWHWVANVLQIWFFILYAYHSKSCIIFTE